MSSLISTGYATQCSACDTVTDTPDQNGYCLDCSDDFEQQLDALKPGERTCPTCDDLIEAHEYDCATCSAPDRLTFPKRQCRGCSDYLQDRDQEQHAGICRGCYLSALGRE